LIEPLPKFLGLYFYSDLATLAHDMSFTSLFQFPHQKRVLEATLRASNVDSFVFKHFLTSQQSQNKGTVANLASSSLLQGTSISGARQRFQAHVGKKGIRAGLYRSESKRKSGYLEIDEDCVITRTD
jgi:hypothetical protein